MQSDSLTDRLAAESPTPPPPDSCPAGFWIRAAAAVIDSGVIAVGSVAIALMATVVGVVTEMPTAATLGGLLLTNLCAIVYLAGMESSARQATLGKRAFGLTVTDLTGRRLSFGRARHQMHLV